MKKTLDFLTVIIGLITIIVCFSIPDHKITISGQTIGKNLNLFGLIIGGLFILNNFGKLKDPNNHAAFKSSIQVLGIFILNLFMIFVGFTLNSSSMLSSKVGDVESMGQSVGAVAIDGAYIPILLSIVTVIITYFRYKLSK
jgi:hypothetical protein